MDIDRIMDLLDWNNPPEVQEEGRSLARSIRCINVFLQPMHPGHDKNVWDNCAIILSERSDQELQPYLIQLFEWLQDMNWPGATVVFNRLCRFKRNELFDDVLNEKIREARALHDYNWFCSLVDLKKNKR